MFLSARRGAYGRIFALIVKLTLMEHYQAYSKLIVFISFCSYDITTPLSLAPNQPVNNDFSEMLFTNRYCFFNLECFRWLHYDVSRNAALCFVCIKALFKSQISTGNVESVFEKTRFRNRKKALENDHGLLKHQQSSALNDAVQSYVHAPVEIHDVWEMISSNITQL